VSRLGAALWWSIEVDMGAPSVVSRLGRAGVPTLGIRALSPHRRQDWS
jgi:hypothetical protein